MAQKRRAADVALSSILADAFSSEEDDGDSAPDSFSSASEEDYEDGKDRYEDMSEDEDDSPEPSTSGGQPLSAPSPSSSSVSEDEQMAGRGCSQAASAPSAQIKVSPGASDANGWQTEKQPDALPEPLPLFCPARTPGVQGFGIIDNLKPSELLKLFFDEKNVWTICENTNMQAKKNIEKGKKFKWTDIGPTEFFKFVGLLLFMAVLKLPQVPQYWRQNTFFSVKSPALVMARNTFQAISWNLHMSDPEKDAENDKKKGTLAYDPLHRLRPLYDHMKNICKAFYHPRQNVSIDERMVATKAKIGMRQYIKNKPTKYGIKLFVLADSSNGYTIDFSIYTGRSHLISGQGLSFDSVMGLIDRTYLGSGYHLYCDNFYTSPKLFKELLSLKVHACGTYRAMLRETPTTEVNALTKKSSRGTMRWIREGPLLFTKWMDSKEVSVCSTIHTAYAGETTQRRVKGRDGQWQTHSVPIPTPVTDYNRYMGGVDLSDQLIQYYSVHHKTMRWYRILFQHFLDIAATNAFILHKELCQMKQQEPMTHLKFIETLAAELCGFLADTTPPSTPSKAAPPSTPSKLFIPSNPAPPATPSKSAPLSTPAPPSTPTTSDPPSTPACQTCLPVPINPNAEGSTKATEGRLKCVHCKKKTAWRCRSCGVALCLIIDRNCFANWHDALAKGDDSEDKEPANS